MSADHDTKSSGWDSRRTLLAKRLRQARVELHGENGGPAMAEALGVPSRTWVNYESGVTVPGHVLLRLLEVTEIEPRWLFREEGPMFRASPADGARRPPPEASGPIEDRETG
jgi:hypothetical protein